jgi:hypothetical protein
MIVVEDMVQWVVFDMDVVKPIDDLSTFVDNELLVDHVVQERDLVMNE